MQLICLNMPKNIFIVSRYENAPLGITVIIRFLRKMTILSFHPIIMFSVTDFSDQPITVEVPANSQTFIVPEFFNNFDDDIDEDEQSFAIVAEIGPDVPENISCFQIEVGETECHGRRGATEIRITDNDRELFSYGSLWFSSMIIVGIFCSNDHWFH